MIIDETKITSFQSIITVVLRELRVAQGIHQAVLSDHCNKPSSFWEKVEAGKTKLDLDTLLRVCRPLDALPSEVISTAEKYRWAMEQRGWSVLLSDIGNADALMDLAPKYWASPGYRFWLASAWVGRTILDTPRFFDNGYAKGWYGLAAVFEFAVDEGFRATQLDEERNRPFIGPPKPGFNF
ncbi:MULTISPECIES: helix-turn-helix domain-containing protein [Burkholderiaceae]|uniref:XRE family transcriptional regulator n=1 Tax=Cupriavidus malaysiensis TaxID=367825 RepID=A0ABN4TGJ6_9BURK|nr:MULTISPECIES: helix-turn-helix transcriptional regulator [Burkholderiaceae]AOZ05831.1 XRE family transcriptional regulator [Cupriavidus malaysiensis]MCA8148166.1 helix-turn-helix transcriptional regulator [Burkholderia vietnamiensis]